MSEFIIFCNCAWSDVIPADVKEQVFGKLKESGAAFCAVDDLCKLAAKENDILKEWAKADSIKIVGCFERTIKWLFERGGAKLPENTAVLNMRNLSAEEIIAKLLDDNVSSGQMAGDPDKQGGWVPWFPVIDYDRCVNCKQCLNFCLFGVYSLDSEGQIKVERPSNCKTNCPACARVCPEAAIIFPKYKDSPINGDEVDEDAFRNADKSKALADLMDGDVHEIIRNRSKKKKRFASNIDADAADDQKAQRLAELQSQLDIPQDVIDSLSSGSSKKTSGQNDCPNAAFCDNECNEKGTGKEHE